MNAINPTHGSMVPSNPHGDLLSAAAHAKDPRAIDAVADNFESLFMTQILKEMRQTLEPGTMFGQDQSDVLGGMFDQFMSQHLSKANALGIAAMVKQQLLTPRKP